MIQLKKKEVIKFFFQWGVPPPGEGGFAQEVPGDFHLKICGILCSIMPYIHYSGIGCNDSQKHTIDEFLNIMTHAPGHYYEMKSLGFYMEYKNYDLPVDFDKFTLEEWLDYTGAVYYEGEPVSVGRNGVSATANKT